MAIKLIQLSTRDSVKAIKAEVEILRRCRHEGIINLYGCWGPDANNRLWILMELCQLGSVLDIMRNVDVLLNESQVLPS